MSKLPIKKGCLITFLIVLTFALLNPGYDSFKEFSGLKDVKPTFLHKTVNGIVFSIYEDTKRNKKYLGIFLNFIDISKKQQETVLKYPTVDSTVRADHLSDAMPKEENQHAPDSTIKIDKEGFATPALSKDSQLVSPDFLIPADKDLPIIHKYDSHPCNTAFLSKRAYTKFPNQKDRIMTIRITCRMEYLWLQKTSKQAEEAEAYIKERAKNKSGIDLTKYINEVKYTKSSIASLKRIKETDQLDVYVYCYFTRLGNFYKDIQKAYTNKDSELMRNIGIEFAKDIEDKGQVIHDEMQRIENKYPY